MEELNLIPIKDNGSTSSECDRSVSEEVPNEHDNNTVLSKNQQKKIAAREKYLMKRKFKRQEEKEKRRKKRQEIKESGQGHTLTRAKATLMKDSACKIRVAVDMAYDDLMSQKDQRATVQQLGWCYAANRRVINPLLYHVVNFNGASRQIYDSVKGNANQDVYIEELPLSKVFDPNDIVYLTADSENVLSELDDSKVYVIGGIVDHNSQKGLCYELAQRNNFAHARLPIDEYVSLKTRKVLTINHVFEILLQFTISKNWEESFFKVIPQRKGLEKKQDLTIEGADSAENEDEAAENREKEDEEEKAEIVETS